MTTFEHEYNDARGYINSGDVILWEGKGLAARLVRWFTKSRWSHVGIALWSGPRLLVLDSFPFKGTRIQPLSRCAENAYWIPNPAGLGLLAHGFAIDELGRKYSFQNLWKTWLGLNLVKGEYHCAQYVAAVLSKAGIELTAPATPETVARDMCASAEKIIPEDLLPCQHPIKIIHKKTALR
jgi:hypothetical protein